MMNSGRSQSMKTLGGSQSLSKIEKKTEVYFVGAVDEIADCEYLNEIKIKRNVEK